VLGGLLGLSGWFIATSAVAGAAVFSSFSYLAPSGGVRSFALGRIGSTYANRVVLHAAGMALIQATAPMVVAAAMAAGGCLVVVLAGCPGTALVLAFGVASCAVLAVVTSRHTGDVSPARAALRRELVTAVDAWTEMASIGATEQLAERTLHQVAGFERRRYHESLVMVRTTGIARVVCAVTLLATLAVTAASGTSVATLVFVVLLAFVVLANAERLLTAAEAQVLSRQADRRLGSIGREAGRPVPAVSQFHASYDARGLTVSGYRLPETPTRAARQIDLTVLAGETLVVTGASGSGKTTFLDALGANLRENRGHVVTGVLADDYVFTGTVAGNIRLANPSATDEEVANLLSALLLDRTGLEANTRVGVHGRDISGGEARRLCLARALATRPDVLLIDEPTTGLDRTIAARVLVAIREHLPDAALVLAIHEHPEAGVPLAPSWSTVTLG
jgi:ATP-binding cassette subfamily C protein CydC